MMTYGDLNLRELRDACGIDFAHFTYLPKMCSCCHSPKDLPSLYWKNREIPEGDDYTYILFKNAENGSGIVRKKDVIEDYECVGYDLNKDTDLILKVVKLLQEQLGEDYWVQVPKDSYQCIIIRHIPTLNALLENKNKRSSYRIQVKAHDFSFYNSYGIDDEMLLENPLGLYDSHQDMIKAIPEGTFETLKDIEKLNELKLEEVFKVLGLEGEIKRNVSYNEWFNAEVGRKQKFQIKDEYIILETPEEDTPED